MRIGTWNLAGRWDERHAALLRNQKCDVWLLTEVSERLELDGYLLQRTTDCMAPRRRWAAILSNTPLEALPDPHPASALARIGSLVFCSSILPWRSCGTDSPWVGTRHVDKTKAALDHLLLALPNTGLVWGGDWNHALVGKEYAGSQGGRKHLLDAISELKLQVPTTNLPHRLPDCLSIDHISISQTATVVLAERIDATGFSDHDAYIIEIG
jgi:hypothetical protein